jgi:hypothetical protein
MSGNSNFWFAWRRGNCTENSGPTTLCGIAMVDAPQSLAGDPWRVQMPGGGMCFIPWRWP